MKKAKQNFSVEFTPPWSPAPIYVLLGIGFTATGISAFGGGGVLTYERLKKRARPGGGAVSENQIDEKVSPVIVLFSDEDAVDREIKRLKELRSLISADRKRRK